MIVEVCFLMNEHSSLVLSKGVWLLFFWVTGENRCEKMFFLDILYNHFGNSPLTAEGLADLHTNLSGLLCSAIHRCLCHDIKTNNFAHFVDDFSCLTV